jgi:hypothetical protein
MKVSEVMKLHREDIDLCQPGLSISNPISMQRVSKLTEGLRQSGVNYEGACNLFIKHSTTIKNKDDFEDLMQHLDSTRMEPNVGR